MDTRVTFHTKITQSLADCQNVTCDAGNILTAERLLKGILLPLPWQSLSKSSDAILKTYVLFSFLHREIYYFNN
jgi:hypothetical protein